MRRWDWRGVLLVLVALGAIAMVASAEAASAAPLASSAGTAMVLTVPDSGIVSSGQIHTCGVRTDGTLACWGDDTSGQASPPSGTFSQVSSGSSHTCGIRTDRTLACWGANSSGQASPPAGTFSQVSAGGFHTCAVRTNGTLACWGDNSLRQASPPAGTFSQVSAGGFHTCGVKGDGTLACWGYRAFGQASPPAGIFSQVSSGQFHTCGVQADGTVACWGDDSFGQASPPEGTFSQVSSGQSHTCGVQTDGTLACWGYNLFGQASPPGGTFSQVSSGGLHTCAVQIDGTPACWGDDSYGQATPPAGGLGPPADTTSPAITLPANITAEATGPSGAVVTYDVTATDPDDAATVSCTPASGNTFLIGQTTVSCTATDTNGNKSNATFTITVVDTTPAVVTISATSPVEASGPSGATVDYTAGASDAVSGSLTPSCAPASGSIFAMGSTTITCTATDGAGNPSTVEATVVVEDTTAPVVTISATSPVEASGPSGATVDYTAGASDTVSGSLTPSCAPPSGSIFALGSTTITCTATDAAGNTSSAKATVVVEDTTAPTLSLPAGITTAATSASGAVVTYAFSATDPDNTASALTVSCSPASGSTFPIGVTTVVCNANDPAGNTSTGSFQVRVFQAGDFSLGPIPPVTVLVGGTASTSVTVNSAGGFTSDVMLSSSGARAGVSLTFSPSSVAPPSDGSKSSNLTVRLSPFVTPTAFTVTVTGTAGSLSHSSPVSITVIVSSSGISAVVGQLLAAGCIDNAGSATAIAAKLSASQTAISAGNIKTAINILTAFINQVRAQSGKHVLSACTVGGVTFEPAAVLIGNARSLINSLAVGATPNPITGSVLTSAGSGVSGATLTLQDSAGATLATATTDITGFYFFATTGLLTPGGTYKVTFTVPPSFTDAGPASQTFTWPGGAEVALAAFTTT